MYILINTAIYKGLQNTITNPNAANTHTIYQTLLRHIMHQPLTEHYQYTKSCNTPTLPKNVQYTNLSSNTTNAHTPTSHQTLPIHQPLLKHYQCTNTNLSSNITDTPTSQHYQCTYKLQYTNHIKHYQYTNLSPNATNTHTEHQPLT